MKRDVVLRVNGSTVVVKDVDFIEDVDGNLRNTSSIAFTPWMLSEVEPVGQVALWSVADVGP